MTHSASTGFEQMGETHRSQRCGKGLKAPWSAWEIGAMVAGFVIFWPIGLVALFLKWKNGEMWRGSSSQSAPWSGLKKPDFGSWQQKASYGFAGSGNAAFDAYKAEQLKRLDEERRNRVVDAVLRDHKWRFAVRQAALAELAGTPTWRYAHRFQLPTDPYCLRVIRVSTEAPELGNTTPWELQGREILTDAESVNIEYIARIADPQQWDVAFLDALVERLASELSMPITNTPAIRQQLLQAYMMKVDAAKSTDGMEGTPEVITDRQLIEVR